MISARVSRKNSKNGIFKRYQKIKKLKVQSVPLGILNIELRDKFKTILET